MSSLPVLVAKWLHDDPSFRLRLVELGYREGMAIVVAGAHDTVAEVIESVEGQPEVIMVWLVGGELRATYVRLEQ